MIRSFLGTTGYSIANGSLRFYLFRNLRRSCFFLTLKAFLCLFRRQSHVAVNSRIRLRIYTERIRVILLSIDSSFLLAVADESRRGRRHIATNGSQKGARGKWGQIGVGAETDERSINVQSINGREDKAGERLRKMSIAHQLFKATFKINNVQVKHIKL